MRKICFAIILVVLIAASASAIAVRPARAASDPASLIAAVNALRAANGLPAYTVSPILMSIAQQHAEFMAVNGISHSGYGGTRPYQRALNAGYPLAGDLSLGGFMSENISGGRNESVQDVVLQWQGDAPHLHTMLSADLLEIGAGVAYDGEYVYYVIDCARPTGGGQPQSTPLPGQTQATPVVSGPLASTVFPNTPNADGMLYHIVKPGETLWLIAISYGVKIAEIRELNYMSETDAIYPSEKLLIRKDAPTATPPPATALKTAKARTKTPLPNLQPGDNPDLPTQEVATTLLPSSTPTGIPAASTPSSTLTDVPTSPVPSNSSLAVLGIIVLAALVLAAVLARGMRPER